MSNPHVLKLTQDAVERLKPPDRGRVFYWDLLLPSFGVRVSSPSQRSGRVGKVYVAMYRVNGKQVMETIAKVHRDPDVAKARDAARESMRVADKGINPILQRQEERRAQLVKVEKDKKHLLSNRIDEFLVWFETSPTRRTKKARRASTVMLARHHLTRLKTYVAVEVVDAVEVRGVCWAERYDNEITHDEIVAYLKSQGADGQTSGVNRQTQTLKQFYKWLLESHYITVNPIAGLGNLFSENKRTRWLSDAEIQAFWWACGQIELRYGVMFKLLLLTACRRNEVGRLPVRRELNIPERLWTLPAERTKSDVTFLIGLTELMIELIESVPNVPGAPLIFSGSRGGVTFQFDKFVKEVRELVADYLRRHGHIEPDGEVERWTLHDLRRTARTIWGKLKVPPDIRERLLNHRQDDMVAVYDQWEYLDEKREGLQVWSDYVSNLVSAIPED